MLPQQHRLTHAKDFALVYGRGRSFFSRCFSLRVLPQGNPGLKIATVVSTKVSKKAVVRNRLKRWMRVWLKNHLPQIKSGSYILTAKPAAPALDHPQFDVELTQLFSKIR